MIVSIVPNVRVSIEFSSSTVKCVLFRRYPYNLKISQPFNPPPFEQGMPYGGMKRECILRYATKEEISSLKDKVADEAKVLELCRVQVRNIGFIIQTSWKICVVAIDI